MPETPLHTITVVLEDWLGPLQAYTDGQDWNGWECPWFEFQEAMKIAENPRSNVTYDADRDVFLFDDGQEDQPTEYEAQHRETVDGTRKLYPLGASQWIWSSSEHNT